MQHLGAGGQSLGTQRVSQPLLTFHSSGCHRYASRARRSVHHCCALPADHLSEVLPALAALHAEPQNALSLPTWAIHVSSVIEWVAAMGLFWKLADVTGGPRLSDAAPPWTCEATPGGSCCWMCRQPALEGLHLGHDAAPRWCTLCMHLPFLLQCSRPGWLSRVASSLDSGGQLHSVACGMEVVSDYCRNHARRSEVSRSVMEHGSQHFLAVGF